MTTPAHDIGDLRRLTGQFKDIAGVVKDPTTITFKMREPDGVLTTHVFPAVIVKDSTGTYHVDFTITKAGRHVWRFEGTGDVVATEEQDFFARRTEAA